MIAWDGKEGLWRESERLMEEWREGRREERSIVDLAESTTLASACNPQQIIWLSWEEKTKQNKTKNPTSPHYAKEDVRGVLSSMQALIQQYLLDAMLIFFFFFFYLCRQLKKY